MHDIDPANKIKATLRRLSGAQHRAGAFSSDVLLAIADVLPTEPIVSLETGCGKSTIMFSSISAKHYVFAYDDRDQANSSVRLVQSDPDFQAHTTEFIYGPTQRTLPSFQFPDDTRLNVIMIDGPHGYPFPDFEYAMLYDKIPTGGVLIIDDLHIPSIGRMFDILREDRMYEEIGVFSTTGVLRRTAFVGVPPDGDHWYEQNYNYSRFPLSMANYTPKRPLARNEAINFSSDNLIKLYGTRAIEKSPNGDGAQTIDIISTFEFDTNCGSSDTLVLSVTYRSIYPEAVAGAYIVASGQVVPLPARASFGEMTIAISPPSDSKLRLDFVHPNAVSEHVRGAKRDDFRRLGSIISSIVLTDERSQPTTARHKRRFFSFLGK